MLAVAEEVAVTEVESVEEIEKLEVSNAVALPLVDVEDDAVSDRVLVNDDVVLPVVDGDALRVWDPLLVALIVTVLVALPSWVTLVVAVLFVVALHVMEFDTEEVGVPVAVFDAEVEAEGVDVVLVVLEIVTLLE